MNWKKLTGEHVDDVKKAIANDILNNINDDLRFYVGCDSQRHKNYILYVIAIVMHKSGDNGGKGGNGYYLSEKEPVITNRNRLWQETHKAVETAKWLNDYLKQFKLRVNEVHADLNKDKKHFSNTMVQSALGYICGLGFLGKIKPEAWCASKVANSKTK